MKVQITCTPTPLSLKIVCKEKHLNYVAPNPTPNSNKNPMPVGKLPTKAKAEFSRGHGPQEPKIRKICLNEGQALMRK